MGMNFRFRMAIRPKRATTSYWLRVYPLPNPQHDDGFVVEAVFGALELGHAGEDGGGDVLGW